MDGAQHDVSQLIDTLGVRLGEHNVSSFTRSKACCPSAMMRRVAALHPAEGLQWPKIRRARRVFFCSPRKSRRWQQLPDHHPPRLFIWRNARHRVAKADGPERITGEWWLSDKETTLIRDDSHRGPEIGGRHALLVVSGRAE